MTHLPHDTCFHCGLPVTDDSTERLTVLGEERRFCCHGCQAVCKTIVDSGLETYYRDRQGLSETGQGDSLEQLMEQLTVYDNEQVQKAFVQHKENWQEAYLILEGIRCSACVWLNELHLRRQPGVIDVHIDDVSQRARVRWDPAQIRLSEILASIRLIGYQAHPYEPSHYQQLQKENKRKNLQRLIFAAVIGMLPMHFALASWFMGGPDENGELADWEILGRWTNLFVTLTILVYPAQEFFYGVWSDFKRRAIGMDVPIVIGLTAVYLQSAYSTVTGTGEVYFESIAMFVLFILISRRLEHQARIQASDQLERLAMAQPQEANRIMDDGSISRIAVRDLEVGDLIHIPPGDRVPVDCEIVQGQSSFDESLLTGESHPVTHVEGDNLIAGSVNYDHPVTARSLHNEMDSTVMEIGRLAESGLQQKPKEALFADRMAARFVIIILLLAGSTALYWWLQGDPDWAIYAVSVLIVTCPCAFARAAPIALTIASSAALQRGLLILDMSVIQRITRIDKMVFDKTGTLTRGKLELVEQQWSPELDDSYAQNVLQSLVRQSEHPVAKALELANPDQLIKIDEVKNTVGEGISARINGETWRLGRCPESAQLSANNSERLLGNRACFSRDDKPVAEFFFADQLRNSATEAVQQLKDLGLDMIILSGDQESAVDQVARQTGIDDYHAGLLPQEKMQWVKDQQQAGKRVAMIGDGINDAPTLALTDVSFSLAESTGLANAHSNMLILGQDLDVLPRIFALARLTMKRIHQNFAWAIGYNLIALPFAMAGMVPPWVAAIGMSLSSVLVVYNSMRIKRSENVSEQVQN